MPASDARISPTAHYTSYVWFKNGLSHEALTSRFGRAAYGALRPFDRAYERLFSSANLELSLLARHRLIDEMLARDIDAGRVGQVVEIAAGLSPRGYRFARRYRDTGLRYVEADLPDMVAHKRAALSEAGLLGANHEIVHIDALSDSGPESLSAFISSNLDSKKGTA